MTLAVSDLGEQWLGGPTPGSLDADAVQRSIDGLRARLDVLNEIASTGILPGTITGDDIAADTITAANIQAGTITAVEIAAATITAANIMAGTITADRLVAHTLTANEIAADTITADEIAADAITASEIAANTITANEIAAHTITANEIASGTITSGEIASGTILTGNIAAGQITTALLQATAIDGMTITGSTFRTSASNPRVVMDATGVYALDASGDVTFFADAATGKITTLAGIGGGNLVLNSGAEGGADYGYWYPGQGAGLTPLLTAATDKAAQGEHSWKLQAQDTGGFPFIWYAYDGVAIIPEGVIPVVPGETYTLSCLVYIDSGAGPATVANIGVDEYDASKTYITYHELPMALLAQDQWVPLSYTFTVGLTTRYIDVGGQFGLHSSASAQTWWDNWQLEAGTLQTSWAPASAEVLPGTITGGTGGSIADQTITAANIAADTITANEIAALTITAAEIAAGTITGAEIAAGAITAAHITVTSLSALTADLGTVTSGTLRGAIIETSSSNPKVRMDTTDGFFITDASGNKSVKIEGDQGIVMLVGAAVGSSDDRKLLYKDAAGNAFAELWTAYDSGTDALWTELLQLDPGGVIDAVMVLGQGASSALPGTRITLASDFVAETSEMRVKSTGAILGAEAERLVLDQDGRSEFLRVPSAQNTRMVAGVVNSNGTTNSSVTGGWSASRSSAGVYVVTFTDAFAASPAVAVCCVGGTQRIYTINSLGTGSFQIVFSSTAGGAGTDQGFAFNAVGLST